MAHLKAPKLVLGGLNRGNLVSEIFLKKYLFWATGPFWAQNYKHLKMSSNRLYGILLNDEKLKEDQSYMNIFPKISYLR